MTIGVYGMTAAILALFKDNVGEMIVYGYLTSTVFRLVMPADDDVDGLYELIAETKRRFSRDADRSDEP